MEEAGPMPERAGWTGTQIAVLVILLVVTNAVTGAVIFFAIPQPTGPTSITVYHPWAGAERDLFLPVLDEFTAQTGIAVTDRTFRQEQLQTLLPPQFTAGRTPADVIFMASGFIRDWGDQGWAMDVTTRVDSADYITGFIDPVTSGSTVYGATFTAKPKPGFWYKNSLFTTMGWEKNPADYSAWMSLLAQMRTDGFTAPLVSGNGVGWPLSDVTEHFIATYGGAQMHRDLTAGTLSWQDPSVRAIFADFLVPVLEAGYFDTPVEWTAGLSDLWAENNAMYFQGSFILAFDQIEDPNDMVSMALPGGAALQGTVVGADYVFVPQFTSAPTEALALFDFLVGVDGQEAQIAEGGGHFPTNLNIDPSVAHPCCPPAQVLGKEPLTDLDDTRGGTFQTTFWAQLQALWANPANLDAVLAAIQAAA